MPRFIDELPPVDSPCPIKVVVVSLSRTGTAGLYKALKVLGFKPYHMAEVMHNRLPDAVILNEAVEAYRNKNIKSYTREDFDKWFGKYDSIVEVPSFFLDDFLAAYPDCKFILTERDPDRWVSSWRGTVAEEVAKGNTLQRRFVRFFDTFADNFISAVTKITDEWTGGKGLTEEGYAHSRQYCIDYWADVKKRIPADRLLCLKLEEGELGWHTICLYLGVEIPNQPWPERNEKESFRKGTAEVQAVSAANARKRMVFTLAPIVAVASIASWYYRALRKG
ncbi:uncharacterized protein E0L32_000264 [Thyridium curvatum]|uniref:P-loop containing nucleoside triphosphate hydrolase protein n=1 Tax=Thyridium curvatum TaxID=1093900 RepID=A0A507BHA1_9PEZI|nr:uncharacterized protein E0L32_000264 [Thyridium curvatum]TPX15930.1 hypothetical protein E0L32_000264 [Thyridium curvatum]